MGTLSALEAVCPIVLWQILILENALGREISPLLALMLALIFLISDIWKHVEKYIEVYESIWVYGSV